MAELGELFSIDIADVGDEKVQFTASMPCNETCPPFGQHSTASVRVCVCAYIHRLYEAQNEQNLWIFVVPYNVHFALLTRITPTHPSFNNKILLILLSCGKQAIFHAIIPYVYVTLYQLLGHKIAMRLPVTLFAHRIQQMLGGMTVAVRRMSMQCFIRWKLNQRMCGGNSRVKAQNA